MYKQKVTTIMTQSNDQPNERDILTRIATIEYQITEIQNTQAQLRATIAPGGYVTDAFERVINRIADEKAELKADIQGLRSELKADIQEVNTKLDSLKTEANTKLDIIIRHMTGMGQE
jgi:chromosome segregation ATPase